MRESNTYEIRCTYCGELLDLDQEICECGKGAGYGFEYEYEDEYCWNGINCIDNILEDKRNRRFDD